VQRSKGKTCLAIVLCGVSATVLASCGESDEPVSPTPRSEHRSTYPCEVMTKAMAAKLLGIADLRRVGAQTLGDDIEQCIWARGRYKAIPQVQLTIFKSGRLHGGVSIATLQRRYERLQREIDGYATDGRPPRRFYRPLPGLGERAFLTSQGRISTAVTAAQGAIAFELTLRLKTKPRSQPPPTAALIALARTMAATMARRPQ
jgi:hypothetical protein